MGIGKPAGYDAALKSILRALTASAFRLLTGADEVVHWRNVELPSVRSLRVDLLGETAAGDLVHIELQSANDADMALRMMEYSVAIRRAFGLFPEQVVFYAGERPMTMANRTEGRGLFHEFRIVNASEIDGEALLTSECLEDNVIAILTRLRDQRTAVRQILDRIARRAPGRRDEAISALGILAGLRKLENVIRQETDAMPITEDIMDHAIIGPKIREGIEIGLKRGLDHERHTLRRMIEKRFGTVPDWATRRLQSMGAPEMETAALRFVDAAKIEEIFD